MFSSHRASRLSGSSATMPCQDLRGPRAALAILVDPQTLDRQQARVAVVALVAVLLLALAQIGDGPLQEHEIVVQGPTRGGILLRVLLEDDHLREGIVDATRLEELGGMLEAQGETLSGRPRPRSSSAKRSARRSFTRKCSIDGSTLAACSLSSVAMRNVLSSTRPGWTPQARTARTLIATPPAATANSLGDEFTRDASCSSSWQARQRAARS